MSIQILSLVGWSSTYLDIYWRKGCVDNADCQWITVYLKIYCHVIEIYINKSVNCKCEWTHIVYLRVQWIPKM